MSHTPPTALTAAALLDLSHTLAAPLLARVTYPWEALQGLGEEIRRIGRGLQRDRYDEVSPEVWVAKSARVAPTACILPPAVIGEGSEVRHCAFIRGNALVGENCVVGNSTELKNCVLFNGVQVPHYNYVGDSILGYRAHMGAGAVTSNVKGDQSCVSVRCDEGVVETERKKCGAMLGDGAEIGCHAVLNPGSVVGVMAQVYPLVSVRGLVPEGCICKSAGVTVRKK